MLKFLSIITLMAMTQAVFAETTKICVKNSVRVANKIKPKKFTIATQGECPKGFSLVMDLLSAIQSADGPGSAIDADTLDGIDSGALALKSELDNFKATTGNNFDVAEARLDNLELETRLPKILRVAATGGDFNSIADAIASISDSSANNPYLVLIAPGLYSVTDPISVPSGVSIKGAGKNSTIINGATGIGTNEVDGSNAVFRLMSGSQISSLSIKNGLGNYRVGIFAENVTVSDTSALSNFTTIIDDCNIILTEAGLSNVGIYFDDSDVLVSNTNISVDNGAVTEAGIQAFYGRLVLRNVAITAGSGIYTALADIDAENLNINASTSGISCIMSGSLKLSNSYIRGASSALNVADSTGGVVRYTHLSGSTRFATTIMGGFPATLHCQYISYDNGSVFNNSCS